MQTENLYVGGMSCRGCTDRVRMALEDVAGVAFVHASLSSGTVEVLFDEQRCSPEQLFAAVIAAGYGVSLSGIDTTPPSRGCQCGDREPTQQMA